MATLPEPNGNSDFTPPPQGNHLASCYRVIDLGTQQTEYLGETKHQRKVLVSWELSDEFMDTDDGPKPFTVHQRYTWSMHEKATLRHHLESWRGQAFVDSDFGPGGFDIQNIIGIPCLVNVVHRESGGKTYANVTSVSRLPKGMEAKPLTNPTTYLWLTDGEFNAAVFDALPDGLRETIMKSPEYHEAVGGRSPDTNGAGNQRADVEDEIPF